DVLDTIEIQTDSIMDLDDDMGESARKELQLYIEGMTKQMLKKRKLTEFNIGDFVRIGIPKIDRFAIDHPNLPCKVIGKTENQQYRLGCKYGIINVCYSSGEIETLGTSTYPELDIIPSDQISVREASRLQSVGL
ncbi:8839_t:CDS:2, partial [Cetraspora pellucida]